MNFIKLEKTILNNFKVSFIGDLDNLIDYINIVQKNHLVFFNFITKQWELHSTNLEPFLGSIPFKDIIIEHDTPGRAKSKYMLSDIGSTMKLQPYLYQKEAINFALNNKNALIILPCGSGNNKFQIAVIS